MHIIDRLDVDFQTAAVISRKLSFWSLILKDELTNMPVSYNNGNNVLRLNLLHKVKPVMCDCTMTLILMW